jgi:hypothetical protein
MVDGTFIISFELENPSFAKKFSGAKVAAGLFDNKNSF